MVRLIYLARTKKMLPKSSVQLTMMKVAEKRNLLNGKKLNEIFMVTDSDVLLR